MAIVVRSRGTALVADLRHQDAGTKKFVGWKLDPSLGDEVEVMDDRGVKTKVRQGGFVKLEEDVTLDVSNPEYAVEYARALAHGDLWPADEATAAFATARTGKPVKFDPLFGATASEAD